MRPAATCRLTQHRLLLLRDICEGDAAQRGGDADCVNGEQQLVVLVSKGAPEGWWWW